MSLMYHDTVIAGTPVIDSTPTAGSNHAVSSGGVKSAITNVESDLASIHATGSTNTTGAKIDAGTYFYLNDVLVRAKTDIAVNATFTSGTNYETVTAGGLNDLKNAFWTLLWTNSNPNNSFTQQDIMLDLSSYRLAFIQTTDGSYTGVVGYNRYGIAVGNYPGNLRSRAFMILTDRVTCGDGYNGATAENTNCVPVYIYGIK